MTRRISPLNNKHVHLLLKTTDRGLLTLRVPDPPVSRVGIFCTTARRDPQRSQRTSTSRPLHDKGSGTRKTFTSCDHPVSRAPVSAALSLSAFAALSRPAGPKPCFAAFSASRIAWQCLHTATPAFTFSPHAGHSPSFSGHVRPLPLDAQRNRRAAVQVRNFAVRMPAGPHRVALADQPVIVCIAPRRRSRAVLRRKAARPRKRKFHDRAGPAANHPQFREP